MTVPAVFEVKVTVHWPAALVPVVAQVSTLPAATAAPPAAVSVTVGCEPATGVSVPPMFCVTVTVNVCGPPTALTPLGLIEMCAPQCSKPPAMKSFRTASTACEARVSKMTLEKHSSARPRNARSMPPSKKVPGGNEPAAPPFALNAHGDAAVFALTVAQK